MWEYVLCYFVISFCLCVLKASFQLPWWRRPIGLEVVSCPSPSPPSVPTSGFSVSAADCCQNIQLKSRLHVYCILPRLSVTSMFPHRTCPCTRFSPVRWPFNYLIWNIMMFLRTSLLRCLGTGLWLCMSGFPLGAVVSGSKDAATPRQFVGEELLRGVLQAGDGPQHLAGQGDLRAEEVRPRPRHRQHSWHQEEGGVARVQRWDQWASGSQRRWNGSWHGDWSKNYRKVSVPAPGLNSLNSESNTCIVIQYTSLNESEVRPAWTEMKILEIARGCMSGQLWHKTA